ncbi:MAG: hypothetical protein AAGA22_01235 [Pseudomonadota bacterium]
MTKTQKFTALAVATLAVLSSSVANAQQNNPSFGGGLPRNDPYGYGYSQPVGQGQSFNGVANVSPQIAQYFTNSGYRFIQGQTMAVVMYQPNGLCQATVGGRTRGRSMTTQSCRYGVQDLGGGRVSISSEVVMNGQTLTDTTTARLMPDGSVFDEAQRLRGVRIQ